MKDFSSSVSHTLQAMGKGDDDTIRIARRTAEVRALWSKAVKKMWRNEEAAEMILSHTNTVGIAFEENHRGQRYKKLFVYVDDSIVLTELNALRERIKLLFQTDFNEDIQAFDIKISQGNRKRSHPYKEEDPPAFIDTSRPVALTDKERLEVENRVAGVENASVREALRKAMVADLQWKKGINGEKSK